MLWVNISALTNLETQTRLQADLATTLIIKLLDGTLVQPETVYRTYLDDRTSKSALCSWKAVPNLHDVLNSFLVMILWEYSIDLQIDLAKTRFPFSTRFNLSSKTCQNLGSYLVKSNNYFQ